MPNEPKASEGAALPKLSARHVRLINAYIECNFSQAAAARASGYSNPREGWRLLQRPDIQVHLQVRLADACMKSDEVLARLSALARVTGDQFTTEVEREVPIYEARPLNERIANLERQKNTLIGLGADIFKGRIERIQEQITEQETELALNPAATYQVQVGTRMVREVVPSLEAARDNGVLFALESIEHTQHGLKFKRQDNVKALELIGKHHKLFTEKVEHSGELGVIGIDFIMPGGDS
jgi:phage terminase small subunit